MPRLSIQRTAAPKAATPTAPASTANHDNLPPMARRLIDATPAATGRPVDLSALPEVARRLLAGEGKPAKADPIEAARAAADAAWCEKIRAVFAHPAVRGREAYAAELLQEASLSAERITAFLDKIAVKSEARK